MEYKVIRTDIYDISGWGYAYFYGILASDPSEEDYGGLIIDPTLPNFSDIIVATTWGEVLTFRSRAEAESFLLQRINDTIDE